MKKLLFLAVSLLSLAGSSRLASAHEPMQITPVSWIVAERHNGDVDDKHVTMIGQITKMDHGSDWWFTDGTAWVRLDTGDKELPVGPKLVVHGSIDQSHLGVGYLEVEVNRWEFANQTSVTQAPMPPADAKSVR